MCGLCQLVFLFLFLLEQGAQIQVHPCVSRFPYHTPLKAEVSVQVLSVSPSGSQVHFLHDSCTKFPYLSPDGLWGTQVLQSLTPSHVLLSWGLQDWSRTYSSVLGGQDTHPKTSRPWTGSVGCSGTCAHTHLHTPSTHHYNLHKHTHTHTYPHSTYINSHPSTILPPSIHMHPTTYTHTHIPPTQTCTHIHTHIHLHTHIPTPPIYHHHHLQKQTHIHTTIYTYIPPIQTHTYTTTYTHNLKSSHDIILILLYTTYYQFFSEKNSDIRKCKKRIAVLSFAHEA